VTSFLKRNIFTVWIAAHERISAVTATMSAAVNTGDRRRAVAPGDGNAPEYPRAGMVATARVRGGGTVGGRLWIARGARTLAMTLRLTSRFFSSINVDGRALETLALSNDLRHAVERGELHLEYGSSRNRVGKNSACSASNPCKYRRLMHMSRRGDLA